MKQKKIIYMPLEIFGRELGGAIVLAREAINCNWTVCLGAKQSFFSKLSIFRRSKGVFFLKSIVPGECQIQKKITDQGHRIVSLDIEGLVPTEGAEGVKLRFSRETLNKCDLVFFYGKNYLDRVISIYPEAKEKSFVTGGLTIDEAKFRAETHRRKIKRPKKTGSIVVATSCVLSNPLMGPGHPLRMFKDAYGHNLSSDALKSMEIWRRLDRDVFDFWKLLIPEIANQFRDRKIIVRPHPTEDPDFWREYLSENENIEIDVNDRIYDSIQGADVFLHHNSTSSVYAFLFAIPTIMISPNTNSQRENWLTFVQHLGLKTDSVSSTLAALQLVFKDEFSINPRATHLMRQHCQSFDSLTPEASKNIFDKIKGLTCFSDDPFELAPRDLRECVRQLIKSSFKIFSVEKAKLLNAIGFKVEKAILNSQKYATKKQPKIDGKNIEMIHQEIFGCLPDFKIEEIKTNVFVLSR